MNVLEVLDVSKNKIKRFPSETDFGNLIQLRVLSISNNKIQQLPKYLHQMSLLKVFKLGHNPLVWPPNDLLQPEQESDQEVWLTALRDYIRINDPPQLQQRQTLLVSDSTPSSRSSSPISNLLYRTSIIESHSCQQNVNLFLSTFQIPSFTKKDRDLLENFVSILYGVTEIHSISSSLSKLIFFQKPRLSKSQLELESQILEQKVSSLIITFQDIIQSTLTLHVLNDLKTKVIGMIKSTKKLIITVSEIFDQQIQSLVIHPMTLNSMMASWSKSNQTLNDTLMNTKLSLTILPIAKNLKVFEKLYTLLLTLKSRFGPILTDKVNMILTKTIEYCFLGDIKLLDSVITLLTSCRKVGKGKEFMTVCGDIANESQIVAKYFNSN
ncbi:hypothetical protein BC833DRAFT_599683 [Globomyces pollinis-pini]|nr:hypothetical protein BC833DRAFT_599683 [Globomyces pollinis-pini]